MYACKESSSERELHTVIVHSAADALNADNLTNELKRHGVEITAAHAYSDLDAVLRNCRRRCIVYLSPEMLNDPRKRKLLDFADRRGRDAVVVVVDDTLEAVPGEWADFTCLRYANPRLNELCRELALLVRTPLLECRPQDITGSAAAFRFFYGYLRFRLPNFHIRLRELYPDDYKSCVKKFLSICPKSCRCPPSMGMGDSIKHADAFILRNITRAGQRHRDISVPVYRIRDEERNRDYYFPAVFAESLASLNDIRKSRLVGIDKTHMFTQRNHYILHLQQLLQHSKDAGNFTKQCRILYWRDDEVALDKFLLPIVREELENEPVQVPESCTDFSCVDGRGVNRSCILTNPAECYKLDSEPTKGVCLIINIAEFESSERTDNDVYQNLLQRDGSEADVRKLNDVFQWLRFEVQCHSNVNKSRFLSIMDETRKLDHSRYDAFVCCIMSHGYLGNVYTADCQTVRILEDIAYSFYPDSCPTLAGKPKIFFIQSCQTNTTHGSVTSRGAVNDSEFSAHETTTAVGRPTVESDTELPTALETRKRTFLLPDAPDFFMSYSTLPRSASYRAKDGSWYMQALAEELKKSRELKDSLDEVAQQVERKAVSNNNKERQRPFYYVSSDHKLVFLSGKLIH